jgi:iron-sulfur cluster repair protein YtfE (RIC family)
MPQIRPVLAVYGIDTCCGGEHALAEACRARGVALADVMREIGAAANASPAPSGSDLVVPAMSIREILRRFPSSAAVFEKHGLADCGGDERSDEPLGWFATVHRIALEPLMADVHAAATRDAGRLSAAAIPKAPARPFSPEYIAGSLLRRTALSRHGDRPGSVRHRLDSGTAIPSISWKSGPRSRAGSSPA